MAKSWMKRQEDKFKKQLQKDAQDLLDKGYKAHVKHINKYLKQTKKKK